MPPRPPKRGPSLAVLGFGGLLIAAAVVFLLVALGLIDPSAAAVAIGLAVGAALAGAGAIAGAMPQRRGVFGLLALGVVLAAGAAGVALLETELDDGVGFRTERPLTAADIPDTYRLGAGELDIDLRDTELRPARRPSARASPPASATCSSPRRAGRVDRPDLRRRRQARQRALAAKLPEQAPAAKQRGRARARRPRARSSASTPTCARATRT